LTTVLRKVREDKNLTVKEISLKTEVPENTLFRIEQGRCGLNAARAKNISRCLQEPMECLFEASAYYPKCISLS